jgi:intraflagellar transport protein 81
MKLQQTLMEPTKHEHDLEALQSEINAQRRMNDALNERVVKAQASMGDDKLAVYRQQSAVIAKKLRQKEIEMEELAVEAERLQGELEEKESKMSEISGSKFMKRDEFKDYANKLRNKTNVYKQKKQIISEITAETVVLSRTEQILRSRATNMDEFIAKQEAKRGVVGYSDAQNTLESISAAKAQTDAIKGKTLDEISMIVDNINRVLQERKTQLAPQIKMLRTVRQEHQEIEIYYLEKRAIYENTAVGLESERLKLESEADSLQEEALQEESKYHFFQSLQGIAEARLDRVRQEEACERGEERLLRDFKTYKDLYNNKITQQQSLSDALRKRHKMMKENEIPRMRQRTLYEGLGKLLSAKMKVYKSFSESKDNKGMGETLDFGGADVMEITQGISN